jgi:hypothetical protein
MEVFHLEKVMIALKQIWLTILKVVLGAICAVPKTLTTLCHGEVNG